MPIKDCSFCSNVDDLSRLGEPVYEDSRCAVLLHPDSAVCGHAMVVWKRHAENVADLAADERAHFSRIHAAAERALLETTGTDRAILLKLGIQVPHLHLHIYPVSASLDREAVMRIIDGRGTEPRDDEFVKGVRRAFSRFRGRRPCPDA